MSPRQRKHNRHLSREGDINYLEGGSPPVAAGLFDGNGARLAWWPEGIPASQENLERVVMELIWTREHGKDGNLHPVTDKKIRKLLENKENKDEGRR